VLTLCRVARHPLSMFRMYIDEVGSDQVRRLDGDDRRYLSLTGTIISLDHVREYLNPAIEQLKAKHLGADPDEVVCLHRTDIRGAKGPFGALRNPKARVNFDYDLKEIISDCEYTVVSALIDKVWSEANTHWKKGPYEFLLEILVEKFSLILEERESFGDIMPEARGKPQDKALQNAMDKIYKSGTKYVKCDLIRNRVTSKNLKFRRKPDNISGIQLCDLIAHPSHYYIRLIKRHRVHLGEFGEYVAGQLVASKYNRGPYGRIQGFGIKYLP